MTSPSRARDRRTDLVQKASPLRQCGGVP